MAYVKHSSSNTSGPQTFELEWQCYSGIQTIRSIQASPCAEGILGRGGGGSAATRADLVSKLKILQYITYILMYHNNITLYLDGTLALSHRKS